MHLLKDRFCGLRLLTNPDGSLLNGEDRQKSKESAPRMARLEPPGKAIFIQGSRRLYDLPVLSVAGTLSITSDRFCGLFFCQIHG
ncbi:acetyltransferase [Yersinia similis]|nr:acetyltransferase [Yersinia similis]